MTNQLRGPGSTRATIATASLKSLAATRIVRPYGPRKVVKVVKAVAQWGTGPAGGYAALAARMPNGVAIIDDRGELTFGQLHEEANALARALAERGAGAGDRVALLCRNHRWFVESTVAVARLGAHVLYLNTAFSGPQISELLEREKPVAVIYDDEFTDVLAGIPASTSRLVAWVEDHEVASDVPRVVDVVREHATTDLRPPASEGRTVILTSGTTGTPKGANRGSGSLTAAAALVSRIPLRYGWRIHIAAPMFHTWGWAHSNLSMMLGSTLVLRRRFDPESFLDTVAQSRSEAVIVIPVMLHRVLDLPVEVRAGYDFSSVRVIAASGSALPGDLASEWMDAFGDTLYNTYGSTECAWATIAQPAEMRSHPGTAGRPPIGTTVSLFDDDGKPVNGDGTGRIFVANTAQFEGYTNGENKEIIDGLMSTGDVGRFADGLLFVEGRDDEMIVSGGENVYPQEIEDCLSRHDAVLECAAVPVDDPSFGQRLIAYVVTKPGSEATEYELKAHVKAHLARYKVPRDVCFLPELPRNSTGKVLKRDLVEACSNGDEA